MKNRKRTLALLLSLALIVSLCACGPGGQADGGESPSAGDPDASPSIEADLSEDLLGFSAGLSADDVLLTVNGVEVKADLMLYWVALGCTYFMSQGGSDIDRYAQPLLDDAVTNCAYRVLLREKAAQLGCLPTDAQVQEARDAMMVNGQDYYDQFKASTGLTDGSMEYLFLSDYYYENVFNAAAPTDEALNNYVYQAKHILLKTVDTDAQRVLQDDGTYAYPALPAETVAEKERLAEDILARIRAADDPIAKFDELMNEFSEDGRDEKTGELYSPDGYTAVLGDMVPGFEQGALALKPGEISGLVESSYGYHIILRGEVAGIESYADDCRMYQVDREMGVLLEEAEITRAPALEALDVAAFFSRFTAYQRALSEQSQSDEGGGGAAG